MSRMQLVPHPATPLPQVESLFVTLSLAADGGLAARFDCRCRDGALRLPQARPPATADELWRHTCCELFAGAAGAAAYREFNWSPSGQWAMYSFSDYRVRAASAPIATTVPQIKFSPGSDGWTLETRLHVAALPKAAGGQIEFGVAAVLEASDGIMSYWALRHAAERPDFHRRETFALHLSDLVEESRA